MMRISVILALLAGALLGGAFPPFDCKWLVWLGLVPLVYAIWNCTRVRITFVLGYLAGLVFFLLTLHPLVSVYTWSGWMSETPAQFTSRMSRQWWFMQGIWVAFALWCALSWGLWAVVVKWYGKANLWRWLLLAPCAWLLLPEWARAQTTFGFTWAFLGNATADVAAIRQLATLGGVWGLSALIVIVNVAIAALLLRGIGPVRWRMAGVAALLFGVTWAGGAWALRRSPVTPTEQIVAAAVQHHKPVYAPEDFLEIGLDRTYLQALPEALSREAKLIVLPESIALGAVSLDGTDSSIKPKNVQVPQTQWETQMRSVLAGSPAVLVIGVDAVERGQDHNTLVAWTAEGVVGWYHKRRLVPFSEYHPWGWGSWALRGQSQYEPGQGSQLIRPPSPKTLSLSGQEGEAGAASERFRPTGKPVGLQVHGLVLGGFICQEVLFPWVTRQSVRDGATVLVSGGNDGVFQDPAVAAVHADAAQLRAVETGRYLVRAMKTGITAIIDPHGAELGRSRSSEPILLMRQIAPQQHITPYVRFGDWLLWLSMIIVLAIEVRDRRASRR